MKKSIKYSGIMLTAAFLCLALVACGENGQDKEQSGGEEGGQTHVHVLAHSAAEEATCMEEGRAEYWYCAGCGKYFSDGNGTTQISASDITLPATGLHRFEDNVCKDCSLEWIPTEGLAFTLDGETDTYTVTGIGDASGDVVIPYYYEEKPVTAIGKSAFNGCRTITGVKIPDSVTSIGVEAFNACTKLTSVTLPSKITEIDTGTFLQCKALKGIAIPEGVTAIGKSAFNYCSQMADITIPESVIEIGDYAFANCKALTGIKLPNRIASVGASTFYNCSTLESIVLPDSVTEIGKSAFHNYAKLTSITVGESVTAIGEKAFYLCLGLTAVNYRGNREQWTAIEKGADWNTSAGNYTVHCADGDIEKEQSAD